MSTGNTQPTAPPSFVRRKLPDQLVVLQSASVAAAGSGYQSGTPIPFEFRIGRVFLESSLASSLVYCRVGISGQPVTSEASRAGSISLALPYGKTDTTDLPDAIPLTGGTALLGPFDLISGSPGQLLYLAVYNRHGATAAQVTALVLIEQVETEEEFVGQAYSPPPRPK